LVKKFNKKFEFFTEKEPWYIEEVIKTLDLLVGKDIIVEVNTGALSQGVQDTQYPSNWILMECFKRDIKICLNSDVHAHNNIECYYPEAIEIIKKCGYKELTTPFETIKIEDFK
jgi:histidinol-phosphatase (PHP family)